MMPYLAAGIAILVVSVVLFWPGSPAAPQMIDFKNTTASAYKYDLPDGSEVTLKPRSQLLYADNFGKEGDRNLELKGEAFFDVQRNPEKPFVINVEGTEVKVLGTSFNVDPSDGVEVKVATGKVKLSAPRQGVAKPESVVLEAGEAARYDEEKTEITDVRKISENEFFWASRKLVYDLVPMRQVAKDLKKYYDVKLTFGNKILKDCKLKATFDDDPIDSIMKVIEISLKITVTKDGNKYLLEGAGC